MQRESDGHDERTLHKKKTHKHTRTRTRKHGRTKRSMEALSVLQAKVESLWEERKAFEGKIARIEQRMENESKRMDAVGWNSMEERLQTSEAASRERKRITKIRGKISGVDGQIRLLEERIDRVQEEEGEDEEAGRVVMDELERALERDSRRVEMEQRRIERLRSELVWMRGEN